MNRRGAARYYPAWHSARPSRQIFMPLLLDALRRHGATRPDAPALRLGETAWSWAQLLADVEARAAEPAARPAGEPAVQRAENTPEFVAEFLGLLLAGHGALPLNAHLPEGEARRLTAQARQKADAPPAGGGWLCLPSSGTTGLPKLVRRELPALDAVARQTVAAAGLHAGDRMLLAVPLSHSYGMDSLLSALLAGATVELENTFDPGRLHGRLRETRATVLPAVPVMVEMLLRMHDGAPLPHLRLVYCAGAPLPPALWREAQLKLGLGIGALYGATEAGSVFFEHGDAPGFDPSCVGFPMEGVEFRLAKDGEVLLRAPSMMAAYWNAQETGLDADGWLATGDLGERTAEGRLRLTGRKKLLIDVGGSKVNPLEVEAILREVPGVKLCVVVPEPVSDTIRRVKALVVMEAGAAFDPAALKAHCKAQLAAHKVPRIFEERESLPVSATGKVLRAGL